MRKPELQRRKLGARSRGNEYRLSVYLTRAESDELREYSDRHGVSHAETVRRGLHLLLAVEPKNEKEAPPCG